MFRNTIYIYRYYWGLEISHQCSVISILPNKLTFGNSALYPESVFICFILISKMKEKLVGCSHAELPMTKWSNVSAYYGKTEVRSHMIHPLPWRGCQLLVFWMGRQLSITQHNLLIYTIYICMYTCRWLSQSLHILYSRDKKSILLPWE